MPDKHLIKAQYKAIAVKQDSNQHRLRTIQREAAQLQGYAGLNWYQLVETTEYSYSRIGWVLLMVVTTK